MFRKKGQKAEAEVTAGMSREQVMRMLGRLGDALDPVKAPGKVRVLGEEEKRAYERKLLEASR